MLWGSAHQRANQKTGCKNYWLKLCQISQPYLNLRRKDPCDHGTRQSGRLTVCTCYTRSCWFLAAFPAQSASSRPFLPSIQETDPQDYESIFPVLHDLKTCINLRQLKHRCIIVEEILGIVILFALSFESFTLHIGKS